MPPRLFGSAEGGGGRCLPLLLANAPREFRDGFNRRQGPAWDAYLRGLAWVKEQIQTTPLYPPPVANAVAMATTEAHIILGPYWVEENVREPLPRWEPAADTRTLTMKMQASQDGKNWHDVCPIPVKANK